MALIKYFIAVYCLLFGIIRRGTKRGESEFFSSFSVFSFIYYSTWILNLIYSLIGTFFTLDYSSVTPLLRPNFYNASCILKNVIKIVKIRVCNWTSNNGRFFEHKFVCTRSTHVEKYFSFTANFFQFHSHDCTLTKKLRAVAQKNIMQ